MGGGKDVAREPWRCAVEVLEARRLLSAALQVNLTAVYNHPGIVVDHTTFVGKTGFDLGGNALSSSILGTSKTWNGNTFTVGPTGHNNVISAAGQTVTLPGSKAASLSMLAAGIFGSQANQAFTVTYTDNSTQVFKQSISDWWKPQHYAGESTAITMTKRDLSDGTQLSGTFYIYGYSFALNSAKTIKSIRLPNNSHVQVLAVDITPAVGDKQSPTAPTGLKTTSIGTTTDAIQWTASTDNVAVVSYSIFRDGTSIGSVTGKTTFADSGLSPSTAYTYTVIASDAAGNKSIVSAGLKITTSAAADTQSPTTPTNLKLTSETDTTASIQWTASTDNVAVTSYSVFRDGSSIGSVSGKTTFSDSGLSAQTTYTYTVIALDAAGNKSDASAELDITTPASPPPGGPPISGSWNLAFSDDFNTINPAVWSQQYWWGGNAGTQATFDPANVTVSNGILSLTATHQNETANNGVTNPYTSGLITTGGVQGKTAPSFSFTYGYIEARTKIAPGVGMWSALWMLPVSHDDSYEMDVFENLGRAPTTFQGFDHHWPTFGASASANLSFDMTQAFHTYGLDWEPDHVTWYVDGKAVKTYTDTSVIPQQAMYLIFNLDVGGSWAGPLNSSSPESSSWQVDYIKVWQHPGN